MPKSISLTCPLRPSITFDGFRSRYTTGGCEVVQVLERVEHLQRDVDDARLVELAAVLLEFVFERDAVDVLHHEVMVILLAEAIEHARDVLVAELREHVGLALKRGHRLLLHRRDR